MGSISYEEFKSLMMRSDDLKISIYMPTHRTYQASRQDRVLFKNLIRKADEQLRLADMRSPDAGEFLKPAVSLHDAELFWEHLLDGLAVFISSGLFRYYRVPIQLPELVLTADRFHVKPLIPLIAYEGKFFILALSQKNIRLFRCSKYDVHEIDIGNIPRNITDALQYDEPREQLQFHTQTPSSGGERAAIFHGHGVGKDNAKDDILRFFQQVDQGIRGFLRNENAPLVLAGVDYLLPIYREANSYPHILHAGIIGNPDLLSPEELHKRSLPIIEPYLNEERENSKERYRQLMNTGYVRRNIVDVVSAAHDGRIHILFVSDGTETWGYYDELNNEVYMHDSPEKGDEDLLDLASAYTYLHGGRVYPMKREDMPDTATVAAILRH
ncbi:MAG TPA: hypothetical protein VHO84_15160 [Syntrophorhabdaceae bacterium]|nr:hypothetical protein [Syntrophorhabdaceae bacterium]